MTRKVIFFGPLTTANWYSNDPSNWKIEMMSHLKVFDRSQFEKLLKVLKIVMHSWFLINFFLYAFNFLDLKNNFHSKWYYDTLRPWMTSFSLGLFISNARLLAFELDPAARRVQNHWIIRLLITVGFSRVASSPTRLHSHKTLMMFKVIIELCSRDLWHLTHQLLCVRFSKFFCYPISL